MKLSQSFSIVLCALITFAANATERDEFFWLGEVNKATAVINSGEGLLDKAVTPKIAKGIEDVILNGNKPGAKRPKKVIAFEPLLIKAAGIEVTMLHIGRSSQDMHATYRAAILRDEALELMVSLSDTMQALLSLAERNKTTIVPNYTNGVAAQPNSYAHYLLGFLSAFRRDAEKIENFYSRLNYCAMGTTVLNGTSWPLNRGKMAHYLGFKAPVENAYDAGQFKSNDDAVEFASILTSISLHVGTFIQDLSVQYAQPRPWILLQEGGENTYVSSAMPQKRNPGLMIRTRTNASRVISDAQQAVWLAHNIIPGMSDARNVQDSSRRVKETMTMLGQFRQVIAALKINPERALEELNLDWTASQEVADVFMRDYKLPFRVGHHIASEIVSYAKANGIKPCNFPYSEVKRIYEEVIKKEYPQGSPVCPMSETQFKDTLNPVKIIQNRKTTGGPQLTELDKSLANMEKSISSQIEWAKDNAAAISNALQRLDGDFQKILPRGDGKK